VIDAHAHLDACGADPGELLARARSAGVVAIVSVGTDLSACRATLALAHAYESVFAVLGIHPHEAAGSDAERLDELRELLADPRAVALGEIGLDYYRDYAPRDAQRALFTRQLELANELAKPVVIHTRAAEEDTAAALDAFSGTVILHCFSSPALLPWALERDCYFSFAGNLTYPKADDLRAAARVVPLERVLVESDCPYLAPQPVRGQANEPAFLEHTIAVLAELRGEDPSQVAALTAENTRNVFSLP